MFLLGLRVRGVGSEILVGVWLLFRLGCLLGVFLRVCGVRCLVLFLGSCLDTWCVVGYYKVYIGLIYKSGVKSRLRLYAEGRRSRRSKGRGKV